MARSSDDRSDAGETSAAPPPPSWFGALARLWCLRGATLPRGTPAIPVVVLSLSLLAAWIIIDRWQRQPEPEFSADGIPMLGWYALGVLGLAALLSWRSRPRPFLGAALVLALGITPLPLLAVSIGSYTLSESSFRLLIGLVAVYTALFLARGLRTLTGRSQLPAALTGLMFISVFIYASDAMNAIPDVWNPRDAHAAPSDDELAERETVLFEQADRIDAALEPIRRDSGAAPESFFLGFAGVGEEKVFAQEIGLAGRVLAERFRIGERHLSLINDERDLERTPIASVSGLRYALRGIASRMDLAKDVLFLALSSHGSEDSALAVSNSQFPLQSLSAEDLAEALHESGIEWRVIIVSACYAGGFIEPLRDPKTIVIAAAATDRTSFGCSSDSDLTYFGEAFYRDALPNARSLRDAFEAAKTAIAAREHVEHVTPSDPQAYFGAAIESRLSALDAMH